MEAATNWLEPLPPGFRFHPTHEEAIKYYLIPKALGYRYDKIPEGMIPEVDILSYEPWDLAAMLREKPIIATADNQDEEWWFFYLQTENQRVRRITHSGSGFWKKYGVDLKITARHSNSAIGTKKTLVFLEGSSFKATRTNWFIHEYHAHATELDDFFPTRKNYVLCRLRHKQEKKADILAEQERPALFSESEIEAMMRSLITPSVGQESRVQIGSSELAATKIELERASSDESAKG